VAAAGSEPLDHNTDAIKAVLSCLCLKLRLILPWPCGPCGVAALLTSLDSVMSRAGREDDAENIEIGDLGPFRRAITAQAYILYAMYRPAEVAQYDH